MHQSETTCNKPTAAQVGANDVLDGRVNDRGGNRHFDEWREPGALGRQMKRGSEKRDGVCERESSDHGDKPAQAAERNDETEQKQQMVDAGQDVFDAEQDEAAGGVVPGRIE